MDYKISEKDNEVKTDAGEGLTPEHIGHLLEVLGEDIIMDMLESAGLEDAPDDETEPAPEEMISPGTGTPPDGISEKNKKKRRRAAFKRRFLFVIIFIGIIGLLAAINKIFMSVTINSNDPIQYAKQSDDISADEGSLTVNDVSIAVPVTGSEEYKISYSWAEEDDKYPSVPHAITAIYTDASGSENTSEDTEEKDSADADVLYTISLYRNETVRKADIPKGKNVSNWFDEWTVVNEGDVLQKPLKSGAISGFYIYPAPSGDEESREYNDYSYYFAVKDGDGISTYVIEGVCQNREKEPEFRTLMDRCIKSIEINSPGPDSEN